MKTKTIELKKTEGHDGRTWWYNPVTEKCYTLKGDAQIAHRLEPIQGSPEFYKIKQKIINDFALEHHCPCGNVLTPTHQKNCARFNRVVNKKALIAYENLYGG